MEKLLLFLLERLGMERRLVSGQLLSLDSFEPHFFQRHSFFIIGLSCISLVLEAIAYDIL